MATAAGGVVCPEATNDIERSMTFNKESSTKQPSSDGPYMQMVYYAVVASFFTTVIVTQLPLIAEYFGGAQVLFYMVFFYCAAANVVRLYLVWSYGKYPASMGSRIETLVNVGSSMTAVSILLYPITMVVFGTGHTTISFWICLGLSAMVGTFISLIMNLGFGLMSLAPPKSAIFYLMGMSVAQVVGWPTLMLLTLVVSKLGAGDKTNYIVGIISLTGAGILTLGLIPMYRYKTRFDPAFGAILSPEKVISQSPIDESTVSSHIPEIPPPSGHRDMIRLFKIVLVPALCLWLVLVFTFDVYPSQISLWAPSLPDAPYGTDTYQSFLIYVFSVADTVGRFVSRKIFNPTQKLGNTFISLTIARGLVFTPLIVLSSLKVWEGVLSADWCRLLLIVMLGLTMGICYTASALVAPSMVEMKDRLNVGTIMSFVMVNGSFVGSALGIGLKFAVIRD